MENTKESKYKVIVTAPTEISFYEILDYLYDNYPIEKAELIANELRDTANKLHYQPERGTPESKLAHRPNGYRYILYKRTSRTDIKVIFYIDQASSTVFITDFFLLKRTIQNFPSGMSNGVKAVQRNIEDKIMGAPSAHRFWILIVGNCFMSQLVVTFFRAR